MSLNAPNLDDKSFQNIVDEVKRKIGARCPEWTDHNVSDPGVTLIELFAWMTDMTLFRLNQVPERNYIKFLEMIGVSLEPPAPAQTDLRFRLSRFIEDQNGEEAFERLLRARDTVAATIRTETELSIEFTTDADLRMVRPRLAYVSALPAVENGVPGEDGLGARDFVAGKGAFPIFSPVPRSGDTLYLGFENDVSGNVIQLEVQCHEAAATGLDRDYPAQRWEIWNGVESRWDILQDVLDTTYGFALPPGQSYQGKSTGMIELPMPTGLLPLLMNGRRAYWVRCRYSPDLPPRGPEMRRPSPYQKPPEFTNIQARTVGGTAPASNCTTVSFRDLGQSDGLPGQVFRLVHRPILRLKPGEVILVGPQGTPREELKEWIEVEDFSESGKDDRHFVCDTAAGEIIFGPLVPEPDGSTRQYGSVPERGHTITLSAYRYGGGRLGNIAAGQVGILKSSIPYIAEVSNPRRADGGREQETLDRAKLRARAMLRQRERAVTAEDYEFLATQASSGVARARCVQPRAIHSAGANGERIPPGVVRVLLVPALGEAVTVPRPSDLHVPTRIRQDVQKYLDERRLLTAVLEVSEPEYIYVSTDITLVVDPKANEDEVVRGVRSRLERFVHPLSGGPNGDGWPFRIPLRLADLYAQVQAASGVAFLTDAKIYVSHVTNAEEGLLSSERQVSNAEGVIIGDNALICSREHRIRAISMSQVGLEETAYA
ncbi:MAG: putative baseplate assembly protein [Janthinobacterium lividum]